MEQQDYNGHVPETDSVLLQRTHDIMGRLIADRNGAPRPMDEQGRIAVDQLTPAELAVETVTLLRQFSDGLAQFNASAHSNPVMKNLLGL